MWQIWHFTVIYLTVAALVELRLPPLTDHFGCCSLSGPGGTEALSDLTFSVVLPRLPSTLRDTNQHHYRPDTFYHNFYNIIFPAFS